MSAPTGAGTRYLRVTSLRHYGLRYSVLSSYDSLESFFFIFGIGIIVKNFKLSSIYPSDSALFTIQYNLVPSIFQVSLFLRLRMQPNNQHSFEVPHARTRVLLLNKHSYPTFNL